MRWLDNSYYLTVIDQLISSIENIELIKIYIFSEGDKKEFGEFEALPCSVTYCLSMPIVDSFIHMCRCDLLIVGLSSFSADPGLINKSLKIVPSRFWGTHPENGEWIVADEQGEIPIEGRDEIKKYLASRIKSGDINR